MKRKVTAALAAGALAVSVTAPAYAAIDEGPGRGNPDTNPAGKCPPGQNNTDLSPGGQKKCR